MQADRCRLFLWDQGNANMLRAQSCATFRSGNAIKQRIAPKYSWLYAHRAAPPTAIRRTLSAAPDCRYFYRVLDFS